MEQNCAHADLSDRLPPVLREVCAENSNLPSFAELCASPELRAIVLKKKDSGLYLPPPTVDEGKAIETRDEILRILEDRYNEQHFLARTDDSLLGHFVYEFKNFRLTGRSLIGDLFQAPRIFQTYTLYHLSVDEQFAREVAPYCSAEAKETSYYRLSHPCFNGPGRVAVHYGNSTALATPIWDHENPRREDLWGVEKKLLGNTFLYGICGSLLMGIAGGGLGLLLRGHIGLSPTTAALSGAIWGAVLGGAPNLLLYSAQIFYEFGSAVKSAITKRFGRMFKDSAEDRANEILLPIYTSSLGIWEKTGKLGAIIEDFRRGSPQP